MTELKGYPQAHDIMEEFLAHDGPLSIEDLNSRLTFPKMAIEDAVDALRRGGLLREYRSNPESSYMLTVTAVAAAEVFGAAIGREEGDS